MNSNHKESGLSLVELLIAISIFSIGILAVAGMQIRATSSNTTARMATHAGAYAQDCVEWLKSMDIDDTNVPELKEGNNHSELPAGFDTGGYAISWDVSATDAANNWRIVTVRVLDPRGTERITLAFAKSHNPALI